MTYEKKIVNSIFYSPKTFVADNLIKTEDSISNMRLTFLIFLKYYLIGIMVKTPFLVSSFKGVFAD